MSIMKEKPACPVFRGAGKEATTDSAPVVSGNAQPIEDVRADAVPDASRRSVAARRRRMHRR